MHHSFEKKLITTKDAGELSGYSSDYLSRLVRSGKISGEKVGHSWLVNKESLERFLNVQGDNKIERARELANARALEYRTHRSLLRRATKKLTTTLRVVQPVGVAASSWRSQMLALSIAFLVVVSSALITRAIAIPQLAENAATIAINAASGFGMTFGDIPARIAWKIAAAKTVMDTQVLNTAEKNLLASARLASPMLTEPNLAPLRMALTESYQAPRVTSSSLGLRSRFESESAPELSTITATDVQRFLFAAYGFISSPSYSLHTLKGAYSALGERAYAAIGESFIAYDSFVRASGATTLVFAAATRDKIALMPRFISNINLALGASIIAATHAAIRADVALSYGTAATAPAFAQYEIKYSTKLARAVFDAEYTSATRFVALTEKITNRYALTLRTLGEVGYESATGTRDSVRAVSAVLADAPTKIHRAYLGILGNGTLTLQRLGTLFSSVSSSVEIKPQSNIQLAHQIGFSTGIAAALSASEQVALATYETLNSIFDSMNRSLVAFFTTTPDIILPTGVSSRSLTSIATSSPPTAPRTVPSNSYPTYTTIVQGVSPNLLNQSLASLRADVLATVSGMIRPVAQQTATNATTIQYVNMIQKLDGLIVTDGDFRRGIFDSGIRVSATDGNFTNLTGGTTNLGTTTVTGSLTVSGTITPAIVSAGTSVSAPYFIATSSTATSTFAGSLAVGTTTPFGNGFFIVGTSSPLIYASSNSGNIGIGTSSPAFTLDVNGIVNASSLYVNGAPYIGSQWTTAGSNIYYTDGSIGVGTTSPLARLDIAGANDGTAPLFQLSSVASFATTTQFIVQNNGRIGIGTSTPASSLDIYGTDALHLPVGITAERPAMALTGQVRYNTTTHQFEGYGDNAVWQGLGGVINAAQTAYITAGVDDYLRFVTTSAERMAITDTGLVGIGTSTPFAQLSVAGTAGGTTNLFAISTSTAAFATTTALTINQNGDLALTNGANLSVGGNLTITGTTAYTGLTTMNGFLSTASSTITSGLFSMNGGASTTQLTTTGSTYLATLGGNVGIGTTSPTTKFSVEGSSSLGNHATAGYFTATTSTASQFPYASTTQLSAYGSLVVGGTSTTTIVGDGSTSTIYGPLVVRGSPTQASSLTLQRGVNNSDNTLAFNDELGNPLLKLYTNANTGYSYLNGYQTYLSLGTSAGGESLRIDTSDNIDVTAHIIPTANQTYDLGSAADYWRNGYINNLVANNLSSASTSIAGTNNTTFSINSNNPTTDTQDMSLIFYRGAGAPTNGVLSWNSTLKRFEFNQNLYLANAATSPASTTLRIASVAAQTGALTSWLDSSGNVLDTVTAGGFLGIGTSTPFAQLSVAGTAGGTTNLFAISTSTAAFATTTALTINQNGDLALTNGANLSVGGNLTITGTTAYTGLTTMNGFLSTASSTITSGLFSMNGGASTTQLTTTGSTYLATLGGNVGIGTTSPAFKLQVYGVDEIADFDSSHAYKAAMSLRTQGTPRLYIATQASMSGGASTDTGSGLYQQGTDNLYLGHGTTAQMTINSGGNVGIGTTTPWLALSVKNTSTSGQFVASYDDNNYSTMAVDATGDLKITAKGGDIRALSENLWICDNGACPTLTATSTAGNVFVENAVTWGNGFSMASTSNVAASELGLYNAQGQLIVIFDNLP